PTLRWLLFSPVPTQTTFGFLGSSTTHPIEYDPSPSNTGVQVVPAFVVFHTPPDPAAAKYRDRSSGCTANPTTRPDVTAGPMSRGLRAAIGSGFASFWSFGGSAGWAGVAASASRKTGAGR